MESRILKYSLVLVNSAILGYLLGNLLTPHLLSPWLLTMVPLPQRVQNLIPVCLGMSTSVVSIPILIRILNDEPNLYSKKQDLHTINLPSIIDVTNESDPILKEIAQRLQPLYDSERFPKATILEFSKRLKHLLEISSKDGLMTALLSQYQIAVDNEKFYERTTWQIASILIPSSIALAGYGFTKPLNPAPVIGGLFIYLFFLFLFNRFRITLRLFREYAIFLESVLGLFGHTFVYRTHFDAFGRVIRIWTLLVSFGAIFVNFAIYVILQ